MFREVLGWRISDKRFDTELWEFEYDNHRYLKNVSDAAFDRRYSELCRNLCYLISPFRDKFPIQAHFLSSWWWLRKLVHMNYEYRLRDKSPRTPVEAWGIKNIDPSPICVPRYPNACDFVVRYSEEQWLRDFIEHGRVRIAPASYYLGEHLDEARQDDELSKHRYQRGDLVQVTTQNGKLIPIVHDLQRTTSFSVNYFVLCSSKCLSNNGVE